MDKQQMAQQQKRRVGIVGYGHLGQYLAHNILQNTLTKEKFELAFIWNRTTDKITADKLISEDLILHDLNDFPSRRANLIVEVSHPNIITTWGEKFLQHADFMAGSPTAFADAEVEHKLRQAAAKSTFGCYIPSGALWGAEDIEKMADLNIITGLTITMAKHPSSLKVESPLLEKMQKHFKEPDHTSEFVVYEGSVRNLCPLAPNNVNTMACASLAAHTLGFDKVKARLVADSRLQAHVIDIEVEGPRSQTDKDEDIFKVKTTRYNPAKPGAITGNLTYSSFLSSLHRAQGRGNGFHFC